MTPLRQRMADAMLQRGFAASTRANYVKAIYGMAKYYRRDPAQYSASEVQAYLLHMVKDRHVSFSSMNQTACAARFLYETVLGHDRETFHIPMAKVPTTQPELISREEIARMFASCSNPVHRMVLQTIYATGLRVFEACGLRVRDIDSAPDRMCIPVENGKGAKTRYTLLSPTLLELLEPIEHSLHRQGTMLNWLPASKRKTLCLMHTPRLVTVRGYLHQGQRPHINFHGVRYTNALLASTAVFLGQELRLFYNSQDLRTVRAFAADGAEIGALKAQGAWGEIVHDLKLRQEILRQRGKKRLASALTQEFLSSYIDQKFAKAKKSRRGASELTQTLRALAGAPTSMDTAAPAAPAPTTEPDPTPPKRIEPQRLSIGTGYVGTL